MILIIDNYDSFVYNLMQYLGELGEDVIVRRNDKVDIDSIKKLAPQGIVISPGPGRPEQAGMSNRVIKYFSDKLPILGVCLGHQCIAQVFGGKIIPAERLVHGMTSRVFHNGKTIFKNIKNPFEAARYHSLVVDRDNFPAILEIIAETEQKEIMALRHREYSVWGLQFHPESILTDEGKGILKNFINVRPNIIKD